MKVKDLYEQIRNEYENAVVAPAGHSQKWRIMAGYALDMLDAVVRGEYEYGTFPVNGENDAKDLTRNVLVNHCRAEQDYKGRLTALCRDVSFGGNFECYNWELAERLGLKPERWQARGMELLERQASFIRWAVLYIERKAGIKKERG